MIMYFSLLGQRDFITECIAVDVSKTMSNCLKEMVIMLLFSVWQQNPLLLHTLMLTGLINRTDQFFNLATNLVKFLHFVFKKSGKPGIHFLQRKLTKRGEVAPERLS